jgi:hypothetical protein
MNVEKQDLIYLLSHDLKNFAGQPQTLATYFRSQARVKFCRANSSVSQVCRNFLKVLKEQDELLQDSDELKWIEFDTLIATVEKKVQQLHNDN